MVIRVSTPTVACAFLLALSGCYSYPQYGQGGYYTQPPGRMMAPQNPSLGAPGPTPVFPEGTQGGGSSSGNWLPPTESGGTTFQQDAPPIGSGAGGGGSDMESKKAVPPADALDMPPAGPDFNQPKKSPDDSTPFEPSGALPRETDSFSNAGESELQFQEPIEVTPASSKGQVSASLADVQEAGPSPFKYDAKEYKYLMGVVEYVEEEKAWHIMYSATPEAADKFGGDITLKDHPGLKGLRKDDVVYVEGHVDSKSRDTTGKPLYHVDHLQKFIPKQRM